VHGGLQRAALLGQSGGDRAEHLTVDRDAHHFHARQHPDQGLFDVAGEGVLPHLGQCVLERDPQTGHHRRQAGVVEDQGIDGSAVHADGDSLVPVLR
jgi:hypothetical protein